VSKRTRIIIIAVLAFVVLMLIPVPVTCGIPSATCTTAPDRDGNISHNVDVEPLGVMLIETLTRKDFPFRYSEYTSSEKASR
jgi:hypothetical protein